MAGSSLRPRRGNHVWCPRRDPHMWRHGRHRARQGRPATAHRTMRILDTRPRAPSRRPLPGSPPPWHRQGARNPPAPAPAAVRLVLRLRLPKTLLPLVLGGDSAVCVCACRHHSVSTHGRHRVESPVADKNFEVLIRCTASGWCWVPTRDAQQMATANRRASVGTVLARPYVRICNLEWKIHVRQKRARAYI